MLSTAVFNLLCLILVLISSSKGDFVAQVNNVVSKTNSYMAQNGLAELSLPEYRDTSPIHELLVYNTKVGNFSSAVVKEIPYMNTTVVDGATMYSFQVTLGLNPVEINYDFSLVFETLIFPMGGRVQVVAHSNSYQVIGTAILKPDGTCQAVLEECKFVEMKNFEVNVRPKQLSLVKQIKKHLIDVMAPHYLSRINKGLNNLVKKSEFQQVFSTLVCSNIRK